MVEILGHSHALFGATLYVGAVTVGAPIPLTIGTVFAAAGTALIPDIDHPVSTVSRFAGPIGHLTRSLTGIRHRGLTHSWLFLVAVLVAVAIWRRDLIAPIGIGWGSHLIGDCIPDTGGELETVIRWILWLVLPLLLVAHFTGWRPWA